MSANDDIERIEVKYLTVGDEPPTSGEVLYMKDGSVWFHPYKGGAPVLITPPTHKG